MYDSCQIHKTTKKDWLTFVEKGTLPDNLRPVIAESWQRCRDYGINPYGSHLSHISEAELERKRKANLELIQIAKPLMTKLFLLIDHVVHIMSLCDIDGYTIEFVNNIGGVSIISDDFYSKTGAKWTEEIAGTNSVGLCLLENRPIQVVGSEHYLEMHSNISCSAAPIHDQNGNLIGCVNIRGPHEYSSPYLLVLAAYCAYSIESQFALRQSCKLLSTTMTLISEGLVILDDQLRVVHHSDSTEQLFKLKGFQLNGRCFQEFVNIPEFRDQLRFSERPMTFMEQKVRIQSHTVPCNIDITPLRVDGRFTGAILLLRKSTVMHQLANIVSGNYARYTFDDIVTINPRMRQIMEQMKNIANTNCSILIEGESGTGKELFAHAIHSFSNRCDGPFIAINCASLPRSLVESELFGYEKGAYTGALREGNPGKFELANDGTIFLDEIGELPYEIQGKLLRVLDTHRVSRIGSSEERSLNIRVIAATNRILSEEVQSRTFREDLYYRLNVFTFHIPPLRERKEDIPVLTQKFVDGLNQSSDSLKALASESIQALLGYYWPGNVRELQNYVVRAYYNDTASLIQPHDFPDKIANGFTGPSSASVPADSSACCLTPEALERKQLLDALHDCDGELLMAAKKLNISRATLYRRIKKHQIPRCMR